MNEPQTTPLPAIVAGRWPTKVRVQCRNEAPFEAAIRFQQIPKRSLVPVIDCPHCGRGYILDPSGDWISDRPLVILSIECHM